MQKKNDNLNIIEIKEELIKYANDSLNMEENREKNILQQSSSNLTVISILIVALFTIVFELLDRLSSIEILIVIFGSILFVVLVISLLFSFKAQWSYKKQYKRTAAELMEHINSNINEFSKAEAFQDQVISDASVIQKSITENNDKRIKDIIVSSVLLYLFIFLLFAFGITILIVL